MDASSEKEFLLVENDSQGMDRKTENHATNGGVSFALPEMLALVDEAGAAQTSHCVDGYRDHDRKLSCESECSDRNGGMDGDAGCEAAQATCDILSPDADVVTVICQQEKQANRSEQERSDGSDSIETLEEEEDLEDSQQVESNHGLMGVADLAAGFKHLQFADTAAERAEMERDVSEGQTTTSYNKPDDHNKRFEGATEDMEEAQTSTVTRPESLSLTQPHHGCDRKRSSTTWEAQQGTSPRPAKGRHHRSQSEAMDIEIKGWRLKGDLGCGDDIMSTSLPHGTVLRMGEMIEFVADDLTEKIKRSSPMSTSKADSSSNGSRRSSQRSIASTSSATSTSVTSGVSRSPSSLLTQSPDAAPPIDPGAVMELEMAARRVADSVDLMMGNLRNNLHKMSAITVGCSEAYKTSVDITCDSVDSSIKAMYALMAKCEELSASMGPIHQIASQIKEIKRLLDLFEAQLSDKP